LQHVDHNNKILKITEIGKPKEDGFT